MKIDLTKEEIEIIKDHLNLNICAPHCYMNYHPNKCSSCKLIEIINGLHKKLKLAVKQDEKID